MLAHTFLAALALVAYSSAVSAADFTLHKAEQNVITKTNEQRGRYGLRPLKMSPRLMNLARRHANWMAQSGNFQHSNFGVAENIAWGQSDSSEAVGDWMNSSGHRANILGSYTHIGVAWARGSDGRLYWVQQFSSGEADEEAPADKAS
jgi:uncharacterized protein YkwD